MPVLSTTIFVSYARADADVALKLAGDLKTAGVNVWLDQLDIPPGERWDRAVEEALERSKRLIVILSPTSVGSENVMDEVSYAIDEKKDIVPVIIERCRLPLRMRRFQFIDFTADYRSSLKKLLSVLNAETYPNEQVRDETTVLASQDASCDRAAEPADASLLSRASVFRRLIEPLQEASYTMVSKVPLLDKLHKKTVMYKSHNIEVIFLGKHTVLYDGEEISRKRPTFSGSSEHAFQADEDARQVFYEVKVTPRWHRWGFWVEVRRDRQVIFSDH